jgi:arabinofuranosyltransferase
VYAADALRRLAGEARARTRRLTLADWVALAALAGICALAVANARLHAVVKIDDAYITFRYSDNLAHGYGPVFNHGEHVEGTSSFLFMVLVAISMRFGGGAYATARALSLVSFVGMVVLAYATVVTVARRARRGGRLAGLGAAVIVAASTPFAYFAPSGMETDFYAFLVALAVFLLLSEPPDGQRVAWAVVAGLVATARPEGIFFALALWGLATARTALATSRPRAVAVAGRTALALACVFGPMILFRRAYYGEWVPNTVIAKAGASHRFAGLSLADAYDLATKGEGFDTLAEYARHLGIAAYVAFAGLVSRRTRFGTLVCLAVAAGCVAMTVWNDGDWMGHARLLTPAMTPVAVAVGLGVYALFGELRSPERRGWAVRAASVALGAAVVGTAVSGSFYDRSTVSYDPAAVAHGRYVERIAATIAENARDDDLLATDMAGVVPFLAKIRTVDTFGLCDAHIAHFGKPWARMGKTDIDYVIGRRPTFYYFNFTKDLADLYKHPSFAGQEGDYLAIIHPDYLKYNRPDRKLFAVRRDRPDLERLGKAMGGVRFVDLRDELHRLGLR